MAEKIKKRVINLLPNKGESLLEQFLSWALNVGRLLVIITEMLALSVFIYRFSLDVKIIDLHDKIQSASRIVENFKQSEETFRNLQARLAFANEYDSKKDRTLDLLQEVLRLGQNKITFITLQVSFNTIDIEAQAFAPTNLTAFIQELRSHPDVQQVTVNRVENSTSSGIVTVSISVELKTNLRQTTLTQNEQEQQRKQNNL